MSRLVLKQKELLVITVYGVLKSKTESAKRSSATSSHDAASGVGEGGEQWTLEPEAKWDGIF